MSAFFCKTCELSMADHTPEMTAKCAVFDVLSADAAALSEAESAPASGGPPAQAGASISIASVLLGWCNDIKRELEEFANDGPVGPMVPYRLEAGVSEQDLAALRRSLLVLTSRLHDLNSDVLDAQLRLTGRVL